MNRLWIKYQRPGSYVVEEMEIVPKNIKYMKRDDDEKYEYWLQVIRYTALSSSAQFLLLRNVTFLREIDQPSLSSPSE